MNIMKIKQKGKNTIITTQDGSYLQSHDEQPLHSTHTGPRPRFVGRRSSGHHASFYARIVGWLCFLVSLAHLASG